ADLVGTLVHLVVDIEAVVDGEKAHRHAEPAQFDEIPATAVAVDPGHRTAHLGTKVALAARRFVVGDRVDEERLVTLVEEIPVGWSEAKAFRRAAACALDRRHLVLPDERAVVTHALVDRPFEHALDVFEIAGLSGHLDRAGEPPAGIHLIL